MCDIIEVIGCDIEVGMRLMQLPMECNASIGGDENVSCLDNVMHAIDDVLTPTMPSSYLMLAAFRGINDIMCL